MRFTFSVSKATEEVFDAVIKDVYSHDLYRLIYGSKEFIEEINNRLAYTLADPFYTDIYDEYKTKKEKRKEDTSLL